MGRKVIVEADLAAVEVLRSRIVMLKHDLKLAEAACAEEEQRVILMLETGCKVAKASSLTASVEEAEGPRRPEWKEIYLDHMVIEHGGIRGVEEALILDTTASKPRQILRVFHKPGKTQ